MEVLYFKKLLKSVKQRNTTKIPSINSSSEIRRKATVVGRRQFNLRGKMIRSSQEGNKQFEIGNQGRIQVKSEVKKYQRKYKATRQHQSHDQV